MKGGTKTSTGRIETFTWYFNWSQSLTRGVDRSCVSITVLDTRPVILETEERNKNELWSIRSIRQWGSQEVLYSGLTLKTLRRTFWSLRLTDGDQKERRTFLVPGSFWEKQTTTQLKPSSVPPSQLHFDTKNRKIKLKVRCMEHQQSTITGSSPQNFLYKTRPLSTINLQDTSSHLGPWKIRRKNDCSSLLFEGRDLWLHSIISPFRRFLTWRNRCPKLTE